MEKQRICCLKKQDFLQMKMEGTAGPLLTIVSGIKHCYKCGTDLLVNQKTIDKAEEMKETVDTEFACMDCVEKFRPNGVIEGLLNLTAETKKQLIEDLGFTEEKIKEMQLKAKILLNDKI